MKTVTDLCREVGVTRKTLRIYKDKGLIEPYNIEGNNEDKKTWKYHDNAVEKLLLIKIFREVDYSFDEIKSMLDMTNVDVPAELDRMIDKLISKMKRIEAYIYFIIDWKARNELPPKTQEVLDRLFDYSIARGKSGYQLIDDTINFSAYAINNYRMDDDIYMYSAENRRLLEQERIMAYQLIALGLLYGENPNSGQIFEFARQAMLYFKKLEMEVPDEEERRDYEQASEAGHVAMLYSGVEYFYSIQDPNMILNKSYSDRLLENTLKALRTYGEACCREGEYFDQLLMKY